MFLSIKGLKRNNAFSLAFPACQLNASNLTCTRVRELNCTRFEDEAMRELYSILTIFPFQNSSKCVTFFVHAY